MKRFILKKHQRNKDPRPLFVNKIIGALKKPKFVLKFIQPKIQPKIQKEFIYQDDNSISK